MGEDLNPDNYQTFEPIPTPLGERVKAVNEETGKSRMFTHEEILQAKGPDIAVEQPPAENPAESLPEPIGTYRGETFDWPVTDILEEQTGDDGRKMLRVKYLGGDGKTNALEEKETWVPADAVDIDPPKTPTEVQEEMPADEPSSVFMEKLSQKKTAAESKASELEGLLNTAKQNAKEAIDADEFQKAGNYVKEAANRQTSLGKEQKNLRNLEGRLKLTDELLSPANIIDLKDKFDRELGKEKDRRSRLQDDQPIDSYADMLRSHILNQYIQTGAEEGQPRHLPQELVDEISAMLAKNYDVLEASLRRREAPAEPAPKALEDPSDEPTQPVKNEGKPISEEEMHFQPGQQVQFIYEGKMRQGGTVSGYRGRNKYGDPNVLIMPSAPDIYWGDITVPQSLVENWQGMPSDIEDSPLAQSHAGHRIPEAKRNAFGAGSNESTDTATVPTPEPEPTPAPEPEPAETSGFWSGILPRVETRAMELRGMPRQAIRRLGRSSIGRRWTQDDDEPQA